MTIDTVAEAVEVNKLRSQIIVYRDALEMIAFCVEDRSDDDSKLIADMCRRVLCADDKEIAIRSYGLALLLAAVSEDKFPPVIDEDKHDE